MSYDPDEDLQGKDLAPEDYIIKNIIGITYAQKLNETTRSGYLSSIKIYDEKYIRFIYTNDGGFNVPGLDALNEASKRDREKPIEERREPLLIGALLTGIGRKGFFGERSLYSFLLDAAKYLNGELPFDWPSKVIGDFIDAGRKSKQPPPDHSVVKIDSTTSREMFQVLTEKGLFGKKIGELKTLDEILENAKKEKNKSELTSHEQREALVKEKYYRNGPYIYNDFGKFSIGLNQRLFIDYLTTQNKELLAKKNEPSLFAEFNQEIDNKIHEIASYKIAYELAYIVLTEVYKQKSLKLIIPKKTILYYLNESTSNKSIYQQVKNGFNALRFLDYIYFDFSFSATQKEPPPKEKLSFTGNFIYNFGEDGENYYLDVNERFVGCVQMLIDGKEHSKEVFARGYYDYPTVSLGLTRHKGTAVQFLTNRLFAEMGNKKLNTPKHKVIAQTGETLCSWASLGHSRPPRRWGDLLKALGNVDIIDKLEPSLTKLKKTRPAVGLNSIIKIYIKADINQIDTDLKEKYSKLYR